VKAQQRAITRQMGDRNYVSNVQLPANASDPEPNKFVLYHPLLCLFLQALGSSSPKICNRIFFSHVP